MATTYTFVGPEGPTTFTVLPTTPKNVARFNTEFEAWINDEANADKTTMELVYHMLQFASKPTGDVHASALVYDDFDVKEGQRLIEDFLPSGTAILRSLSGY